MHKAAVFATSRMQKQPKWPSVGKWRKDMWYIHTVEHYLAI